MGPAPEWGFRLVVGSGAGLKGSGIFSDILQGKLPTPDGAWVKRSPLATQTSRALAGLMDVTSARDLTP